MSTSQTRNSISVLKGIAIRRKLKNIVARRNLEIYYFLEQEACTDVFLCEVVQADRGRGSYSQRRFDIRSA